MPPGRNAIWWMRFDFLITFELKLFLGKRLTKVTGANSHQDLAVVAGSTGVWRKDEGRKRKDKKKKRKSVGDLTQQSAKATENTYMLMQRCRKSLRPLVGDLMYRNVRREW